MNLGGDEGNVGRIGHESIGAGYLRSLGFGGDVCCLVGSHVAAKRYGTAERVEHSLIDIYQISHSNRPRVLRVPLLSLEKVTSFPGRSLPRRGARLFPPPPTPRSNGRVKTVG